MLLLIIFVCVVLQETRNHNRQHRHHQQLIDMTRTVHRILPRHPVMELTISTSMPITKTARK